jgi:spiro-SPASM protein
LTPLSSKINAFDIETLVSPKDQRSLRVEFSLEKPSTVSLIQKLGPKADDKEVKDFVDQGTGLRTLPRHFTFQLTDFSRYRDQYRFRPELRGEASWPLDALKKTLKDIKHLSGEGVISFALCEASEYPFIVQAVAAVQALETFDLVIETSGRGWSEENINSIKDLGFPGLIWILELDSREEKVYQEIKGDGFAQAQNTAESLISIFPDQVYPQAVRTPVTDPHLENFYKYWKEKAGKVIIQKHNSYSGRRSEEKILDLAPIQREPCWHIKRDLVFWSDLRVSPCREDWEKELTLGNLPSDSLQEIWEKGDILYKEQLKSSYKGICEACDEYYIYHF